RTIRSTRTRTAASRQSGGRRARERGGSRAARGQRAVAHARPQIAAADSTQRSSQAAVQPNESASHTAVTQGSHEALSAPPVLHRSCEQVSHCSPHIWLASATQRLSQAFSQQYGSRSHTTPVHVSHDASSASPTSHKSCEQPSHCSPHVASAC